MSLWAQCKGRDYQVKIQAEPWRVVEAQHVLSSRDLVDSRDEHDILEALLESSKPAIEQDKHYLIFTPFRYPPLKHGSRFGQTFERSLWYGSLELETAFAEVAHYRLQFFQDSQADLGYIEIPMTAFKSILSTPQGIDLTAPPFEEHGPQISDKHSYMVSQALGTAMREDGIEAFIYYSARTTHLKKNIAAFTPEVFLKKNNPSIRSQQNWWCIGNKQVIEFSRLDMNRKAVFTFTA